jgi:hypothetical protein
MKRSEQTTSPSVEQQMAIMSKFVSAHKALFESAEKGEPWAVPLLVWSVLYGVELLTKMADSPNQEVVATIQSFARSACTKAPTSTSIGRYCRLRSFVQKRMSSLVSYLPFFIHSGQRSRFPLLRVASGGTGWYVPNLNLDLAAYRSFCVGGS